MMTKFFSHNCPTINFLSMVNHFCYLEILRTGGFSAESIEAYTSDSPTHAVTPRKSSTKWSLYLKLRLFWIGVNFSFTRDPGWRSMPVKRNNSFSWL